MQGEIEDKCGIVGIHSKDASKNVSSFVYYCLYNIGHAIAPAVPRQRIVMITFRVAAERGNSCIHQSGCWPSCAFHAHSVSCMLLKTAVNDESSGEHA